MNEAESILIESVQAKHLSEEHGTLMPISDAGLEAVTMVTAKTGCRKCKDFSAYLFHALPPDQA